MESRIFADGLLADQVVLVAGGGSGPGRAVAVELAECGASVVMAGSDHERLAETADLCAAGRCHPHACDVRVEQEVVGLVDAVLERHGRIDTLVNDPGGESTSFAEHGAPQDLRSVMDLELEWAWLTTHAVATRAMIPAGGGKVVNVTLSPQRGLPGMAHSAAARAAVENMTRTLSIEWARFNIRLTAIASDERPEAPEEQAWLVAYLASPAGDYHSGSILTVGGATAA